MSSIATSLIHSLTIFFTWKWTLGDSAIMPDGRVVDIWAWGTMVFATDLISVTMKACLIINSWVSFTMYVIFGSLAAFFVIFPPYAVIGSLLNISPQLYNTNFAVFRSPAFWFGLLLIPILVILRDVVWK